MRTERLAGQILQKTPSLGGRSGAKRRERTHERTAWENFLVRSFWSLLKGKDFESLLRFCVALGEGGEAGVLPGAIILKEVAKSADVVLALKFLEAFPKETHRKHHTQLLRRSLREARPFEVAAEVFDHCVSTYERNGERWESQRPDALAYSEFISCCASAGREEEGLRAFEAFARTADKTNVFVCNSVLALLVPHYNKCSSFFESFVKEGFVPDVDTLNTLMRSAIASGRNQKCEDLYNYMRMLGITPNAATFSCLIRSYGNQGKYVRAQSVVSQMQSLSQMPNEGVWLALLAVMALKRDVNLTQRMWMKIQRTMAVTKERPSLGIFAALARACMLPGEGHLVFEALQQARDQGKELDHECHALAIQACTHLHSDNVVRGEDFARAWEYYLRMREGAPGASEVGIETLRLLLSMACEVRDPEKFQSLLDFAVDAHGPSALQALAREVTAFHLSQGEPLEVVWQRYREWRAARSSLGKLDNNPREENERDERLFARLLRAAIDQGDFARAFDFIADMRALGFAPKEDQIAALENHLVEHRISSGAMPWDASVEAGAEAGANEEEEVVIKSGSAISVRFQVLCALDRVRKASGGRGSAGGRIRLELASARDSQVVCALLENDLKLKIRKEGRRVTIAL